MASYLNKQNPLCPKPEMLPALRELWQASFDDSKAVTDLIFQRLARPENIRVLTDGRGVPLSMLFIQPARLQLTGGEELEQGRNCAYIYGVATREDRRGQGLGSRLLEETARDLALHGLGGLGGSGGSDGSDGRPAKALALVPSGPELVGYYSRLGFASVFSHRVVQLAPTDMEQGQEAAPPLQLTPRPLAALAGLRDAALAGSPWALLWSRDFLEFINEECRLYQGETLHFAAAGRQGYLVYYRDGGGVLIKEYLELAEPDERAAPAAGASLLPSALAALHRRLGAARYTLRLRPDFAVPPGLTLLPEGATGLLPFGMLRFLDGSALPGEGQMPGYLAHAMD